jgi:hypothetical protein
LPDSQLEPADEALIVAYVDDDLSPEELAQFEARLATEPALEAALHKFLDADEFGWQLGQRGLLRPAGQPPRRWQIGPWLALAAAAVVAAALLWRPDPQPLAVIQVAHLERGTTRGDSDPSLKFGVRVRVSRSCHVLVLTVCSLDVEVRYPPEPDPFGGDRSDWPKSPFSAGQDVLLPPGERESLLVISDRGLVVICAKVDGAFDPAAIKQLRNDLRGVSAGLSESLRLPAGHPDRVAHVGRVEAVARRGRPGWQVSSEEIVPQ